MNPILDVCCGSRMFYFDKNNRLVHFNDLRKEKYTLSDGRTIEINPETQYDFQNLPFPDASFKLVIFDPPHLLHVGDKSWLTKKYGTLNMDWKTVIYNGFNQCMRVLASGGTLIFKWSDRDISLSEILNVIQCKPIIGDRSRTGNSIWLVFYKE